MTEVAQSLGVAPSTVSRALRGDPRIGDETRRRAREMADRLGYRPNPLVSALMANRRRPGRDETDTVALVTDYGDGASWRTKEVCRWEWEGIAARAGALGFRVEVFALAGYGGDAQRLADTLQARGIQGVLLGFARREGGHAPFCDGRFAVAGLSAYFRSAGVDRANFHGFYNVRLALTEMARLGYHRPGLVVPELNNGISNNLWSGAFLDWQRQLPKIDRIEPFLPGEADGADAFEAWWQENRPDSLLVYKVPVRRYLARQGQRVPEDVGLAYLYRTSDEMGATAGIDGNLAAVGAAALELVVEKLNANVTGLSACPKEVLVKGTWRPGATLPEKL